MTSYETVKVETTGSIGKITLNRPERLNAYNIRMGLELQDALRVCEEDEAVRAIILTGAGRSFCSGDDLSGQESDGFSRSRGPDPVKNYVFGSHRWTVTVNHMRRLPKPIIAAIRGHAHGAGFNLALAADIRIASENANLAIPFIKWAMATGANQLHYFIPIGIAMELAFTGDSLDAQRAERLGLVNHVVPDAELESASLAFAERLAAGPSRSIGLTKAAIYKGWGKDIDTAYDYQSIAQAFAGQTEDRKEGQNAFREKRPPNYQGR